MELEMHTFDTHKHIKELKNSGLAEAQAEAIVKSLIDSREYDFSKLATKEQLNTIAKDIQFIHAELAKFATKEQLAIFEEKLATVEERLTGKINALEERLTGRMNAVEGNILKWMVPLFLTTWVMIAGLIIKFLSH